MFDWQDLLCTIRMWSKASPCISLWIKSECSANASAIRCLWICINLFISKKGPTLWWPVENLGGSTYCDCRIINLWQWEPSGLPWFWLFSFSAHSSQMLKLWLFSKVEGEFIDANYKNRLHFLWMFCTPGQSAMPELSLCKHMWSDWPNRHNVPVANRQSVS